jgi:hypothetical protein
MLMVIVAVVPDIAAPQHPELGRPTLRHLYLAKTRHY